MKNIFKIIPKNLPQELTDILLKDNTVRIERIVSRGHNSPKDFWYDQNENEWVILLKGDAVLIFKEKEKDEILKMKEGDYINIPAYKKHRIEQTSKNEDTIWLCIYY